MSSEPKTPCPNCARGYDPVVDSECPSCGVIFAKFNAPLAKKNTGESPSTAIHADNPMEGWQNRRLGGALGAAAGLTALILAAWLIASPPPGLPIPSNAERDPESGFAVSLPPGWKVVDRGIIFNGRLLNLRARPAEGPGWLEAVVISATDFGMLPAPGEVAGLQGFANAAFDSDMSEYTFTPPKRVEVDRLRAVQVPGAGRRVSTREVQAAIEVDPWVQRERERKGLAPQPVTFVTKVLREKVEIAFIMDAVPGSGRDYLVGVMGDRDLFMSQDKAAKEFLASFRVTERPLSARHILSSIFNTLKGEAQQEIVVGALVALWAAYRWIFSPLIGR